MVLDMQFADGTLLRVREPAHLDPVSITPGLGTHRLLVRAEVEPIKVAPGCNLALLDGELHAEHPTGPRWVGSFHPVAVPLRTNPPGWLADLVVALTDAQVLALEKDRNGHDLQVWPKQVAKPRNEQTQADRYGVILDKLAAQADGYAELLQALFNQASGPQHTSGALRGARWVRADAVALTGLAAAMLHRLAEEIAR